jgi:hypothetical protein
MSRVMHRSRLGTVRQLRLHVDVADRRCAIPNAATRFRCIAPLADDTMATEVFGYFERTAPRQLRVASKRPGLLCDSRCYQTRFLPI